MKSKRNGKIELLRFLFCITVVIFHCNKYYLKLGGALAPLSVAGRGYIGVEFFFVVSGFLMAKSALKAKGLHTPIATDTPKFLLKKAAAIFPPHTVAFVIALVPFLCTAPGLKKAAIMLVESVPGYFFLNKTGIPYKGVLSEEWYIGVMLTVMAILYPLLRKFQKNFSRIIAPLVAMFLMGYLAQKYGNIAGVNVWDGFVFKCFLRGIIGICLGTFSFEIAQWLKTVEFSKGVRVLLTLVELSLWGAVFLFAFSTLDKKYGFYALLAIFVAVTLTFSEVTCLNQVFNNKLCYTLGKLSLPIYICQGVYRQFNIAFLEGSDPKVSAISFLVSAVVLGVIVDLVSKPLAKWQNKKLSKVLN